ncbi:cell wall hydrolase [Pseudomarimonas salicorniae]|uniref:Cell wall hydrolase n=1 Tax=Pseudomarimonas salicorniae TaxID=2933270 RepID=A0ABT0GI69_9GAMM|nr:cell wall hydrolase [Lysobacter sp. CAU 1642]MCK7593864.1 cell wall hydrolase [Lysobacter sp. CAU 1642]
MKLALMLWLASVLPQPVSDPLCLATTVYLEARNQSELGQQAVAEVALRRLESGRWGGSVCEVVTSPKQFAPTLVSPQFRFKNLKAWNKAVTVAFESMRQMSQPQQKRRFVVPGADHFHASHIAPPQWAQGVPVAQIGDHRFYKVTRL